MRTYRNWIDGAWASDSGAMIERHSPAHGALLARFQASGPDHVAAAVAAARRAFDRRGGWPSFPASQRAGLLQKLADLMERDAERLAVIEAEEVGKPIRFARGEVAGSIELTRYAGALAWQISGDVFSHLGDDKLGLVTREPRGVVGMIIPWNFPLVTLFQKLPFALAAGCSVVVKPSELTSGTALEVAALSAEAGFPAGVINIVTGTGSDVGEALTDHPGIDMMSFTGSTAVGKRIAGKAGAALKRVALELGGKAANTVFADADLEAALDGVLFGMILNQGEECCAGSRLLVEQSIARDFVERLVERARKIVVGMPLDERTDIGALIHEQHLEKVLGYVAKGQAEGAQLAIGGDRLRRDGLEKGFFVGPTVLTRVTPAMTVFREEIFGPVLTVTPFDGVEQAVALANDTAFGLANGLWTKDVDKALQVSKRLKSGTVYVNTYLETAPQLPFGGFKQSGIGRENGLDGLLEFTEVKSTFVKLGARPPALPHVHAGPR
jgi:acyl-CoA reductase-like NAD-dependent aldehyde dehydrogenase